MTTLLTDRLVAGAGRDRPTHARQTNVFDTKTRGLVLRLGASTKTFYFTYRTNGGPTEWMRLGAYPGLSLADARTQALALRHAIEVEHRDPAVERRTPPPAPEPPPDPAPRPYTFDDFTPTFITFQKGKKKTWRDDQNMIAKYLTPAWGSRPLNAITRRDVQDLLDTVVQRGLKEGTNRVQALISRIFTVALDRGKVDAHPAVKVIKRFAERASERVLTDDELRALWKGLDAQPGAAADAIRLRALLGQRGDETAGMCWAEIDLQAAVWSLPGRRTKNSHPHAVALPPSALALLTRRRAAVPEDEPRVFPGLVLTGDAHKALSPIHGGAYEWKDLRRTLGTRLAGLGFDETVIGRVLNHAKYGVTGKHYNQHQYVDEIRGALTAWDTELQRVIANKPKTKATVVSIRRGR